MNDKPAILCVDDEPNVLAGIALNLRRRFDVTTATSGVEGLEALSKKHYAIVLSDMRMPNMNGTVFLSRVRTTSPDTVRMLLTGQSDIENAIGAINEGQIFRFLTKPCSVERLVQACDQAMAQYRLVISERELLEKTLRGSVKMLVDVLALLNPTVFGRAMRIKDHAIRLAREAKIDPLWPVEVAAMLSQIGCVTLQASTLDKLYHGAPLTRDEQSAVDALPSIAEKLLSNIPRIDDVRACIAHEFAPLDAAAPKGARVLRIVSDFDALESRGMTADVALAALRGRQKIYDGELLEIFCTQHGSASRRFEVREIKIQEILAGMSFAEDVKTKEGVLLLPRGYEITESLIERIRNFHVESVVRVLIPLDRQCKSAV